MNEHAADGTPDPQARVETLREHLEAMRAPLEAVIAAHDQGEYFNGDINCCVECDGMTRVSDFVPFAPCSERQAAEDLLGHVEAALAILDDAPHIEFEDESFSPDWRMIHDPETKP